MDFPNDANGDVLRRMEAKGDNLKRPRDINFSLLFAEEASAEKFAKHFRSLGYKVSVKGDYPNQNCPWDVCVVRHMAPSYDAITEFEDLLQSVADNLGGRNDGWGCFSGQP